MRSEEHTSELQSQSTISYAVFCLKKKKKKEKEKKKKKKKEGKGVDKGEVYEMGKSRAGCATTGET